MERASDGISIFLLIYNNVRFVYGMCVVSFVCIIILQYFPMQHSVAYYCRWFLLYV